jgi:hypothetical protein
MVMPALAMVVAVMATVTVGMTLCAGRVRLGVATRTVHPLSLAASPRQREPTQAIEGRSAEAGSRVWSKRTQRMSRVP